MSINEQQLQNWARALSDTENSKCSTTFAAISKVLKEKFGTGIDVFLQGSYKNSTNVRQDSDVDIVACYKDVFFSDTTELSPEDKAMHDELYSNSEYKYSQFKNDVEQVLMSNFPGYTERKSKCIKINNNSYRVNADVVPCFVHRRYRTADTYSAEGIQFFSDNGERICSFPRQHYENGVEKNKRTNQKYKSSVRTLKNCKNYLVDNGELDEKAMPSFFLECLIWNVSDEHFDDYSHKGMINNVVEKIYEDMNLFEKSNNYAEISDLFWLFKGRNSRSPEQAKQFLEKVYNFIN
jgi:hypothetical protein